ncbi:MAG: glycerophosphodiester phosphodiesterase family protein [Moraxellaceae bacterium]|nr:glycerophosphodiester phosphodiesterase family protein [Moraxellaceae bacterium]
MTMHTRLIGHRGARGEAPENTLAGFHHLINLGIRAVEFDIRVSADQELIVIHDDRLERTTNGVGLVREYTHAELSQLDACRPQWPYWPNAEGVPTLAQVLALLTDFEHIELEVKPCNDEDQAVIVQKLPALWQQFNLSGRTRTTSFDLRYLSAIAKHAPELTRGFLFEHDFAGNPIAMAQALGCSSLGPHQARCEPELIQQAHDAGLIISTWTVNDAERAQELVTMGVDGIITDVPTQALEWLADS